MCANLALSDYDSSTLLFYPTSASPSATPLSPTSSLAAASGQSCLLPRMLASTFDRWDAVHFAGVESNLTNSLTQTNLTRSPSSNLIDVGG